MITITAFEVLIKDFTETIGTSFDDSTLFIEFLSRENKTKQLINMIDLDHKQKRLPCNMLKQQYQRLLRSLLRIFRMEHHYIWLFFLPRISICLMDVIHRIDSKFSIQRHRLEVQSLDDQLQFSKSICLLIDNIIHLQQKIANNRRIFESIFEINNSFLRTTQLKYE